MSYVTSPLSFCQQTVLYRVRTSLTLNALYKQYWICNCSSVFVWETCLSGIDYVEKFFSTNHTPGYLVSGHLYLMSSKATTGNQRSQQTTKGHNRLLNITTGHQKSQQDFKGHNRPSKATTVHEKPQQSIKSHNSPSKAAAGHQT